MINEDTQFEGIKIDKEQFEKIWKKAIDTQWFVNSNFN